MKIKDGLNIFNQVVH